MSQMRLRSKEQRLTMLLKVIAHAEKTISDKVESGDLSESAAEDTLWLIRDAKEMAESFQADIDKVGHEDICDFMDTPLLANNEEFVDFIESKEYV